MEPHPNIINSTDFDNGIYSVLINRPPINSISLEMIQALRSCVQNFINSNNKVMMISGSGTKYFIGGADLEQIASISDGGEGAARAQLGQNLCYEVYRSPKPIIAIINGDCIGGGNELAAACHIRIASSQASFQQPELHLGIIPGFGGTQFLPRLVGESTSRRLILACERIGADEALRIKLVDMIASPEQLTDKAHLLALNLCSKSQAAIRAAHLSIANSQYLSLDDGLKKENHLFRAICEGQEMREALAAYKEKRKPNFKKS